jgi:fumarylacetoacetate (FAA) hydrolase
MKFASLKSMHSRDGELCIVNRQITHAIKVSHIASTLQNALERWDEVEKPLLEISQALNDKKISKGLFPFNPLEMASPLPRSFQWADGSAFLNHVALVRKARGAEMPPDLLKSPLLYQGGSDYFLSPTDPIVVPDIAFGIDFEAEIAVIVDDVAMGTPACEAEKHIKLILLVNDVSLRNLIPAELQKGFGFYQSKPASSFSPLAITQDELGIYWKNCRVHLPLKSYLNDKLFGEPNAGDDMAFSFADLIAYAAKTRHLKAGTIIGSGTVSNKDQSKGSSCIAEKRMIEKLTYGQPKTPFMQFGDTIHIEMFDNKGNSIFGAIHQRVEPLEPQNEAI